MPRTFQTQYERVEEKDSLLGGKTRYIRLKSGREVGFILDAVPAVESALSALGLWLGRAAKLASSDYEQQRVDHLVERLNDFARAWQHSREMRVKWEHDEEAIRSLENPNGKTPAELEESKRAAAIKRSKLERERRGY